MPREETDTTPGKEGGTRYVRRDGKGQFTDDQTSAGRSNAQDRRIDAENEAKKGDKDRGD
ncbi:MAG TPA: hypothetical protein VFM93_10825 [Candidatus Limnocylindria bacterium]|nr:hypothetical protein [Candidatus Limnocylindria bacterium]